MPFRRKKKAELGTTSQHRSELMTVQDIANHIGAAGFVIVVRNRMGYIGRTPASIGKSAEGQVWITSNAVVDVTPEHGEAWAHVTHVPGEGLTVYLPDEFGNRVRLLADNPPESWIPASPGKDPGDVQPRGISAPDDDTGQ